MVISFVPRALGFTGVALGLLAIIPATQSMNGQGRGSFRPGIPKPPNYPPPTRGLGNSGFLGNQGNQGGFGGNQGGFGGNQGGFGGNQGGFGGNQGGFGGRLAGRWLWREPGRLWREQAASVAVTSARAALGAAALGAVALGAVALEAVALEAAALEEGDSVVEFRAAGSSPLAESAEVSSSFRKSEGQAIWVRRAG